MKKILIATILATVFLCSCGKKEVSVAENVDNEPVVEDEIDEASDVTEEKVEALEVIEEEIDEDAPILMEDGSYDLTGIAGHIGMDYFNGRNIPVNIDDFGGEEGFLKMLEEERERFRQDRIPGEIYVVGVPYRDAQYYYDLIEKFKSEGYEVIHYYTESDQPDLIQFHLSEFYISHLVWDEGKQEYSLSDEDKKVYEELFAKEEELEWISRGDRGFEIIE